MQTRGSVKNPAELVLRYDALRTIKTIVNHSSAHKQKVIGKEDHSVVEEIKVKNWNVLSNMGMNKQDTLAQAWILYSFPPSLIYPFRQPEKHITL